MKHTMLLLAAGAALWLNSCSSAVKQGDAFEAAIDASLGAMVGGIMGVNAGGGQ
jgi:hypothetical protein